MAKTEIENTVPVLGGWETVRLIGRGSFGAVYEIRKTVLGDTERCALKHLSIPRDESEILELRLEGQDGESITRTFTSQARSIVSEYRLMMQLNNCPNVVSSYDVEAVQKDGGYGWDILIRMELLTPLKKYLVQQQDYPETETLRLGREIANALVACRRQKILHRDIKPENIMVAADGTYKLGDFGIARTAEKTGSATAQIGTYAYMAPEVYNGEHYGALADQYSLGMVLYWLLNGRRAPFVTVNTAEEKETALRRRMRGEALPAPLNGSPEFKRIVLKCCAYDPAERFQSPEELIKALDAVGAIHESPADPGERRFAPVGAAAPDDPQTETDGDGLSRTPAPTAETTLPAENETVDMFGAAAAGAAINHPIPAENETVDMFGTAPVGAAISRPPVTSEAESPVNTVEAELAPAREQGQTTEPPGGEKPLHPEEDATVRTLAGEKRTEEPKKKKKGLLLGLLAAVLSIAALLALLFRPQYGEWSEWSTEEPEQIDGRKIETGTEYRYREMTLLSTTDKDEVVGEIDHEGLEYGAWGDWSDWQEEKPEEDENTQVEEKTQYCFREKEFTTATTSTLAGWEQYDSKTESHWSSYSAWSPDPAYASDTRRVQTKNQTRVIYSVHHYTGNPDTGYYETVSVDTGPWKDESEQPYEPPNGGWINGNADYLWETDMEQRTVYSYSDLITTTTYSFYRWGDMSDWSFAKKTGTDDLEVKTRQVYRSKSKIEVPMYYYYDWSDWSDWAMERVEESNMMKVETRTVYRYKDRMK